MTIERGVVTVLLMAWSLLGCADCSVDLTLSREAVGSAVVTAVVDVITQSCLFVSDRLMLRRIAYAETTDGTASHTFTSAGGGIWQVHLPSHLSSAELNRTGIG